METEKCKIILKALADDTRLKIFEMLRGGTLCGCKILEQLKITQPTLSHHMKVLTDSDIVKVEKDWKWSYYSINCEVLENFIEFMSDTKCKKEKCNKTENKCD